MVDVIHYMFESDNRYGSGEEAEGVDKTRETLYSNMYGMTYKYGRKTSTSPRQFTEDELQPDPTADDIKPFNPKKEPTKSFIPPTQFNPESDKPFGLDLDAPLK